ncbi:MAG: hypothetical protein MJE77_01980 [Proteobacteria bacterium]|nr:hypothetical protein [Pseudomonadota bacterium]
MHTRDLLVSLCGLAAASLALVPTRTAEACSYVEPTLHQLGPNEQEVDTRPPSQPTATGIAIERRLIQDQGQDLDFVLDVRAVDLGGNTSPWAQVEVIDRPGGCHLGGNAQALPLALLGLLTAWWLRRRQAD